MFIIFSMIVFYPCEMKGKTSFTYILFYLIVIYLPLHLSLDLTSYMQKSGVCPISVFSMILSLNLSFENILSVKVLVSFFFTSSTESLANKTGCKEHRNGKHAKS